MQIESMTADQIEAERKNFEFDLLFNLGALPEDKHVGCIERAEPGHTGPYKHWWMEFAFTRWVRAKPNA